MSYLLLSGATGLLGTYLIRDLTAAGVRLAVLVRPTRMETSRQRVESLIDRWEKIAGHSLPRPVILEGDLRRPDLGLTDNEADWVRKHCRSFMHNAASLTFYGDGRNEEPYLSNLNGTRNVLEFCQNTGISEFHHVSTAYVCGARRDRVLESELDKGQQHGNDYEISKFESELMVRNAGFLESLTVYRPGIIVGDSETGYTTTFHGFYVPLKLVSTLMSKTGAVGVSRADLEVAVRSAGAQLTKQILNTQGHEKKNLVPVDWVSSVMAHVFCHQEHHGRTYHLTPEKPVPVAEMQQAIEDSFIKYTAITSKAAQTAIDWDKFGEYFYEQMLVYRSYWGDDPEFDTSNTIAAAPHLPCPVINGELLQRQCRYAIEANFGWPKPRPVKVQMVVRDCVQELMNTLGTSEPDAAADWQAGCCVNGNGGGQWVLEFRDGKIVRAAEGLTDVCSIFCYLNSDTFEKIHQKSTTIQQAFVCGHLHFEGDADLIPQVICGLTELILGGRSGQLDSEELLCSNDTEKSPA
jgi:thioester reductase-like protein